MRLWDRENVIMGPWKVNRGMRNVNRGPCNVIRGP